MTKNGQPRSVLLNAKAKEVIESLKKSRTSEVGYVFPSMHGAKEGHLEDLRKPFDKVCDLADIRGLRIHDLRHSFATIAVMSGASLHEVQKLLGHSDVSMTQRYAHLAEESLQRATDGVSQAIDRAVAE
jgi:site-specific recombinase XerD